MARHVKKLGEEAKVAIRGVRQDARKQIAAWGRGSLRAVQEATDAVHRRDRPAGESQARRPGRMTTTATTSGPSSPRPSLLRRPSSANNCRREATLDIRTARELV